MNRFWQNLEEWDMTQRIEDILGLELLQDTYFTFHLFSFINDPYIV